MSTSSPGVQFVVHWLHNKELHFTHEAESLLEEMGRRQASSNRGGDDGTDDTTSEESESTTATTITNPSTTGELQLTQ